LEGKNSWEQLELKENLSEKLRYFSPNLSHLTSLNCIFDFS
jgi:hypothetical protein